MAVKNYALYPHMTVYENMAFGVNFVNIKKDDIATKTCACTKLRS